MESNKININLNHVYQEDNLKFLKQLPREFFDLIYIDPPFFTQSEKQTDKNQFNDQWESLGHYLDFMNMRLKHIHRVLKQTGSLYVHLDWHASHFVKILLDKIFGCENFRNEIIWRRTKHINHQTNNIFPNQLDSLFFFTKTENYYFNPIKKALTQKQIERDFSNVEEETGLRFTTSPLLTLDVGNGNKVIDFKDKGKFHAPEGYRFIWTQETYDKRIEENPALIYWTKNENPRYKSYLKDHEGTRIGNLWIDIHNVKFGSHEWISYPTQKPEALLERILLASSERGDLVGDFFAGSGTTLVVAKKLKRNYLGCDHNPQAIDLIRKRLKEVDVYATITDFSQPERKKQLNEKKKKQHAKLTTWLKK